MMGSWLNTSQLTETWGCSVLNQTKLKRFPASQFQFSVCSSPLGLKGSSLSALKPSEAQTGARCSHIFGRFPARLKKWLFVGNLQSFLVHDFDCISPTVTPTRGCCVVPAVVDLVSCVCVRVKLQNLYWHVSQNSAAKLVWISQKFLCVEVI